MYKRQFHYWALYEDEDMPDPIFGDWSANVDTMPKGYLRTTYWLNNVHRFSLRQMKKVRRAYYALITQIDYSLGPVSYTHLDVYKRQIQIRMKSRYPQWLPASRIL